MNRNTERIEYSSQLATMYVENMQLLTMFCKENYALTASEYELLLVLLEAQSRLRVQQLADFLVLKPSTIWQMALALEDRGLVSKTNDEDDRRLLCLSLSKQGEHLIRECNQRLTGIHEDVTYDSLPNIEHTQYLHSTIGESLDLLRGHSTDVTIPELPPTEFRVEFMVFMRVIIEQWKECIRSYAELSFTEFRILHVLEGQSPMRMQDVSDFLLIARSQVSIGKRTLKRRGFLCEERNLNDARSIMLKVTQEGHRTIRKTLKPLNEITIPAHRPGMEEGVMVLRAWHTRMYYNLRKHFAQNS